jgi:hypothetical protein
MFFFEKSKTAALRSNNSSPLVYLFSSFSIYRIQEAMHKQLHINV